MPRVLLELLWKQLAPLRAVRLWPREHEQIGVGAATTLIVHTGLTDPAKANVAEHLFCSIHRQAGGMVSGVGEEAQIGHDAAAGRKHALHAAPRGSLCELRQQLSLNEQIHHYAREAAFVFGLRSLAEHILHVDTQLPTGFQVGNSHMLPHSVHHHLVVVKAVYLLFRKVAKRYLSNRAAPHS